MSFRTIIISRKANQITEMLPTSSAWGWFCLYNKNDFQAAQAAVRLSRSKGVILTPFHAGLLVGTLLTTAVICAFSQGMQIDIQHGSPQNQSVLEAGQ
ncbi:MAG: hypothetical protein AAFW84_24375 [Cyanobacteria bacterium J06635_15]